MAKAGDMKKLTRSRLDTFLLKNATTQHVLDVGSSTERYQEFFPNVTRLDIDPTRHPNIVADCHNIPLADNSQQFILFTEVLEHCYDPQKAISELRRILKSGGTLVLTTRFIFPIHGGSHVADYFRFTEAGLRHLLNGFEIIDLQKETTTNETISVLMQRLIFQSGANKIVKSFFMGLSYLFQFLPNYPEYTNIERTDAGQIMTSGYYIVARKV